MLRVASELTSVSIFALNLVTGLGLGLAIDYSLFMVSRYREEIARSGPGAEAMRPTMRTAGRTMVFSSLTVAVALASLSIFPQRFLYSMGIGGAAVALIAAGLALVVLPAILALLGTRVNSLAPAVPAAPSRARRAARRVGLLVQAVAIRDASARPDRDRERDSSDRARDSLLGIKFTSVDATVLPTSASARQVDTAMKTEFPPHRDSPIELAVSGANRAELEKLSAEARKLPGVATVNPPQRLAGGVLRQRLTRRVKLRRSGTQQRQVKSHPRLIPLANRSERRSDRVDCAHQGEIGELGGALAQALRVRDGERDRVGHVVERAHDHEGPQMGQQVAAELRDVAPGGAQALAGLQDGSRVARGDRVGGGKNQLGVGNTEHSEHVVGGDLLAAVGDELVERAERVAEAAGRAAGDGRDGAVVRRDPLGVGNAPDHRGDLLEAGALEVEALTAVGDRGHDLVRLGRAEHEGRVRRRLLERLQERVPGLAREHVRLVEDVDLPARPSAGA